MDLSAKEAAEKIGVSISTIYNWYGRNVFPDAYRVGFKKIMIPEGNIERFKKKPVS